MSERVEISRRYQFPGAQGVVIVSDITEFVEHSDGTHFFRSGDSDVTIRPNWSVMYVDYAPEEVESEPEPEPLPLPDFMDEVIA